MITIKVNSVGKYYPDYRDEFDLCDAYDIEATFKPHLNEDGEEEGNLKDVMNMFAKACVLEGYNRASIAQDMYSLALCMAKSDNTKLYMEEDDGEYLCIDRSSRIWEDDMGEES